MPPSKRKPPKKAKPKGLPSPCPTPFFDLRTQDCFVYRHEDYPATATCIRFLPLTDDAIPDTAFEFFLDIVGPMTSRMHACIHATTSLFFIADVREQAVLARLLQVPRLNLPSTSLDFTVSQGSIERTIKDCLADLDMELGLENCPTDYSMPSSSEDEVPQSRKQAGPRPVATTTAKHAMPAVQPTPPTRSAKPAASVTPAAVIQPPQPAASQAEASPAVAASVLSPAVAAAEAVEPTITSALSSQPDASQPASDVRRRRFRYKAVNFAALDVPLPTTEPCLTLLIRPVSPADDLRKRNSQLVARELAALGDLSSVRDIRNGGLAIDFPPTTPTAPLLAITSLAGCKVICSLPVTETALSAVVSGVHPDISEADILADMVTSPPIKLLAVKRLARPDQESWTVKITVEGKLLPERALLYGRSRRVTPFLKKPLQCRKCGRFGHSAAVCRSNLRCLTCGESHDSSSCQKQAMPSCSNCGGAHPASAALCPARQLEVRVSQVQVESGSTFRAARVAVQRAAKTYAAAARGPASKPPAPQNRPPLLLHQPSPAGGFIPSVPHPRPPQPPNQQSLVILFKGILSILTAATASADLSSALLEVAALFRSHAPGADAAAFQM